MRGQSSESFFEPIVASMTSERFSSKKKPNKSSTQADWSIMHAM
jgi:hypothetical protein